MVAHTQVAIALIIDQGQILLGWRDAQQHQGNCYEFPGGKVEAGETAAQAVRREVFEETGLNVHVRRLFSHIDFSYPDRHLSLYFYRCYLSSASQQHPSWHWQRLDQLSALRFPAANQAIVARLDWPTMLYQHESARIAANHTVGYLCTAQPLAADHSIAAQQHSKLIVAFEAFKVLSSEMQAQVFAIYLSQPQRYQPEQLQAYLDFNWIAGCETLADAEHAQRLGCEALICLNQDHQHPLKLNVAQFADLLCYQSRSAAPDSAHLDRCYQLQI